MIVLFHYPSRMGFKRHGDRSAADSFSFLDGFMEKGLMPDVDAVEIADGNNRIFERFDDLIKMSESFHKSLFLKGGNPTFAPEVYTSCEL